MRDRRISTSCVDPAWSRPQKNSAGGFAPGPPLRSTLCMAIARSARQRRCVSHSLGASVGTNLLCRAARDGHAHSSSEQTILRKLPTFQSQAREANKSAPTQSLGHVFFRAQLGHSPCGPSLRRRLGDKLGPKNFGFGLCHILSRDNSRSGIRQAGPARAVL